MQQMEGYDVVVVGGGPGGFGAAVSAARAGAKTLLIEREGFMGGGATVMMVNPFMPCITSENADKKRFMVNAGIFAEVAARLEKCKAGGLDTKGGCVRFDDEALKLILDEMAAEAGVTVLFHAALYDVQTSQGKVQAIYLAHNSGPIAVGGKVFIDSTGDALLSARAGAQFQFGDEAGKVMPMTLFFVIGGADLPKIPWGELRKLCAEGGKDNPPLVNTNLSCTSIGPSGMIYINAIRIPGNTLDAFDLSRAEAEGRRRVENYVAWLKARVAGFENCYLVKTACHIGVRESRRVVGDYTLTGQDFDRCAKFDDGIACCSYPVDIHQQEQGKVRIEHLPPGEYYQIPYRCLTPKGLTNLLVASRSISCDVRMHSSLRVMPPVMNIGEAAGLAAAMSLPASDVRAIDVKGLRDRLRKSGAAIEPLPMKV
ncbi:MAG: FAD-dependent oxidoreductase [Planctomycetes bacterium]|nr:FAD-dependent oxidoreductase [Planctomycetota bacterium]